MKKRTPEVRKKKASMLMILALVVFMPLLGFWVVKLVLFSEPDPGSEGDVATLGMTAPIDLPEARKNIYDRNFKELAVSFSLSSIYARPLELKDPEVAAKRLAALLGLDERALRASLKGERSFVWVGRQVSREKAAKVAESNMKGVHVIERAYRFYPYHKTAAQMIGFVKGEQGLAGLESYYDNILRGGGVSDSALAKSGVPAAIVSGEVGAHLVTTLDLRVQNLLERDLRKVVKETGATAGAAVVMTPESGEILGLASLPTYDPNRFWAFNVEERKNRAVAEPISPAGLRKLFYFAASLESGGETGRQARESRPAKASAPNENGSPYWARLQEGLYVSPELLAFHDTPLAAADQARFASRFGLCGKTGVDLSETEFAWQENIESLAYTPWPPSSGASEDVPRQGTGVDCEGFNLNNTSASTSALALLTAFSRLVNGGKPIVPHFLRALWDGKRKWNVPPSSGRAEAFRPQASSALLEAMSQKEMRGHDNIFIAESLLQDDGVGAPGSGKAETDTAMTNGKRFQAVMLASTPGKKPEVAMIFILQGAHINLQKPSPLRRPGREIIGRARRWARATVSPPTAKALAAQEAEHYRRWLALRKAPEFQPLAATVHSNGRMPDVRGHSLRKALQVLQQYGLRVRVSGAGRVVAQHPAAGASLRGLGEGKLELRVPH